MQQPTPDNQQFSLSTLKGFLLKNVSLQTNNPLERQLNQFLVTRVDQFWKDVALPLHNAGKLDGNKINWYFEIYKEALEARNVAAKPFHFLEIKPDNVKEIIDFLKDKDILDYCGLGTSFLTSCYTLLTSWFRDQLSLYRLREIYSSDEPLDWIKRAEEEEHGVMQKNVNNIEELQDILQKINLIIAKRV